MTQARPSAEQLAGYTLDQQHPLTAEWSDRRRRLTAFAEQHRDDLAMMVDLDLARFRRDLFAPHLELAPPTKQSTRLTPTIGRKPR